MSVRRRSLRLVHQLSVGLANLGMTAFDRLGDVLDEAFYVDDSVVPEGPPEEEDEDIAPLHAVDVDIEIAEVVEEEDLLPRSTPLQHEGRTFKFWRDTPGVSPVRYMPVPFVDAETGSPVIALNSKKSKFGLVRQVVLDTAALPFGGRLRIAGLQVSCHEWHKAMVKANPGDGSDPELQGRATKAVRTRLSSIPIFGRDLRMKSGLNLLMSEDWNPLSFYADDAAHQSWEAGLRGYPDLDQSKPISMEIALGPTGRKRKKPYYVTVSLLLEAVPEVISMGGLRSTPSDLRFRAASS